MSKLETRAEIIKLARLFDLPESRIEFLHSLPATTIKAYRERAESKLFSDDITLFRRLSLASKLIPAGLVGLIGQHVFGPVLSARVAGEMEYRRAVKLAMKLPVDYLADICLHLDPRRTEDIIRNVPAQRIREVCVALLGRGEYITMGRFVGYLTDEAIVAAIEAFENEADLLMVGFFAEDKPRLDSIIRLLSDARLLATIVAAQDVSGEHNLWAEAVALMVYVQDDLKRKLGDIAASQDQAVLAGLLDTAHKQQLWSDVLPVVACMSPASQRKVSELPTLVQKEVMTPILQTAHAQSLWHALLPLVETMPQAQLQAAAHALTQDLPPEALEVVLQTAARQKLWTGILPLFGAMGPAQAERIGEAVAVLPESAIEDAVHSTDENNLWASLLPLAQYMPDAQRKQVAIAISELPPPALQRLVDAAAESEADLQAMLLNMLPLIPPEQRKKFKQILKPLFDGSRPLPQRKQAAHTARPTQPETTEKAQTSPTEAAHVTPKRAGPPSSKKTQPRHAKSNEPGKAGTSFGLKLPGVFDAVYRRVENTFPVTTALSLVGLDKMQKEYEDLQAENQQLRNKLEYSPSISEAETQQKDIVLAKLRREKQALEEQLSDARRLLQQSNEAGARQESIPTATPTDTNLNTPTATPTPAPAAAKPSNWRRGGMNKSGSQRARPIPTLKPLADQPKPTALKRHPRSDSATTDSEHNGMSPSAKVFLGLALIVAGIVAALGVFVLWLMSQQ